METVEKIDWEKLRRKVSAEAFSVLTSGPIEGEFVAMVFCDVIANPRIVDQAVRDIARKVRDSILRWPVEEAGCLRSLFPGSFPRAFARTPIGFERNADGRIEIFAHEAPAPANEREDEPAPTPRRMSP